MKIIYYLHSGTKFWMRLMVIHLQGQLWSVLSEILWLVKLLLNNSQKLFLFQVCIFTRNWVLPIYDRRRMLRPRARSQLTGVQQNFFFTFCDELITYYLPRFCNIHKQACTWWAFIKQWRIGHSQDLCKQVKTILTLSFYRFFNNCWVGKW